MATLVCFHAHPDDEAIATGGTMALAAAAGHDVVLVMATRGEVGEPVEGVLSDGETLGERREQELRHSAELLNVGRVEFLGYEDSGMIDEPTNDNPACFWQADREEAAHRLADLLREVGADILTVYDEHGGYGHPDHIQVHRVGRRAAEIAGVDRVFWSTMNRDMIREQMASGEFPDFDDDEAPDERMDVETFGSVEADITHAVDVTSVIDLKRASMAAHASQIDDESFFLKMPPEIFAMAFGTEWYVAQGQTRAGDFETDLFATKMDS